MPDALLPQQIDSTMMSCFRSCPQKFYNEFCLGLRPPGLSVDLHAGACFAAALEAFYTQYELQRGLADPLERSESALLYAHSVFMGEWGDFEIPDYKRTSKTKDRMWEAFEDYLRVYPPETDHVKPLLLEGKPSMEFSFAVPLEPAAPFIDGEREPIAHKYFPLHPSGDPFIYCGRFDSFAEYLGRRVVRDEKTTGRSIGRDWAEQWDLRSQFIGYTWASKQLGYDDVDTVVVRGIAIQKTQFGHAEAIKVYSDHLRAVWIEQLRRDLWRLRRAWDARYFDYNLGETCTSYGNCQFMPLCTSATPESWYSMFEVRRWNPLEKDPTEEAV